MTFADVYIIGFEASAVTAFFTVEPEEGRFATVVFLETVFFFALVWPVWILALLGRSLDL